MSRLIAVSISISISVSGGPKVKGGWSSEELRGRY
jgi:hypothetical protein